MSLPPPGKTSRILRPSSRKKTLLQCMTLEDNVKDFGITYFGLGDKRQGIVHIIGPEQGFTLPGTTVVCGDSHTSTHGAFGSLAFGIGTSEIEHVLATQTLITRRSKNMRIQVDGELFPGVSSKDIIFTPLARLVPLVVLGRSLSSVALPSEFEHGSQHVYLQYVDWGRCQSWYGCSRWDDIWVPQGPPPCTEIRFRWVEQGSQVLEEFEVRPGCQIWYRCVHRCGGYCSHGHMGHQPRRCCPDHRQGSWPGDLRDPGEEGSGRRMLEYMGLTAGTPMEDIVVDKVFIGSCTNARIEDLRAAAVVVKGRKVAANIKRAMIVPGSGLVKDRAEAEGLDKIFTDAGFEWREAGCSMCLGMNPDILSPKERCASTSNRNFEGRQGAGGRTHLVSPVTAAACAIVGKLTDVRKLADRNATPRKASPSPIEVKPHVDERVETDDDEREMIADQPEDNHRTQIPWLRTPALASPNSQSSKVSQHQWNEPTSTQTLSSQSNFWRPLNELVLAPLSSTLFDSTKTDQRSQNSFSTKNLTESPRFWLLPALILDAVAPENTPLGLSSTSASSVSSLLLMQISSSTIRSRTACFPSPSPTRTTLKRCSRGSSGERDRSWSPNQIINDASGKKICSFEVEEFRKHCLVNGLDDIGLTMQMEDKINAFEKKMTQNTPWLDGSGYLKRGKSGKLAAKAVPVPKTNRGEEVKEPLEWWIHLLTRSGL